MGKRWIDRNKSYVILIGFIVTVSGWFFNNLHETKRDRANKLIDIRNDQLANAYRDLSLYLTLMNHGYAGKEDFLKFESALKNIQLYGTKEEIRLLTEFLDNFNLKGNSLDPLLNEIRNNIRRDFNLDSVDINTFWIIDTSLYQR